MLKTTDNLPETIYGGYGDDKLLSGGIGNDILYGGTGNDILNGGAGANFYVIKSQRTISLLPDTDTIEKDAFQANLDKIVIYDTAALRGATKAEKLASAGLEIILSTQGGVGAGNIREWVLRTKIGHKNILIMTEGRDAIRDTEAFYNHLIFVDGVNIFDINGDFTPTITDLL